ncbi:MAG: DUF58 domain-containing protein [Nanoarchaeota archaeon]|nr:DUF58 domain-containing protein [Nanoarchaeota archaeon]
MPVNELRLDLVPTIDKIPSRAKRDILSKTLEGEFTTLFKGKGMEFAGFREYTYSDDASMIDWAASLRSRKTLVRQFEVQKNFSVFFMLDVSDKMLFCSTKRNKLKVEHGAELVSKLAYAMLQANNAVGMCMFTDKLVTRLRPNIGRGMIASINRELSNINNYGGACDFKQALLHTNTFLKRRCLIIIISDFIDMPSGWSNYLNGLRVAHELMGIMIRDPRDEELPHMHGQFVLEDPFSTQRYVVDVRKYKDAYANDVSKDEEEVREAFGRGTHTFVKLRTDKEFLHPIMNMLKKRAQLYKYV